MKVEMKETKKPLEHFGFIRNNHYYWYGTWYASILDYKSLDTLQPSIEKAKKICLHLGIPYEDNFIKTKTDHGNDVILTKFACFLIALQADGRKPVVRRARSYFLNELEDLNILLSDHDYLNRMIAKYEITHLNKSLIHSAGKRHVKDFQFFINEGYLGMYNKTMAELKDDRGIDSHKNAYDFMSTTELAANIFRISLTAERLKYLRNPSESKAAREHWKIGSQIRSMIKENTGSYPENLPVIAALKELQKRLKVTQKTLNKEIKKITVKGADTTTIDSDNIPKK